MPTLHLLTLANEKYRSRQNRLKEHADNSGLFRTQFHVSYEEEFLTSDFYQQHLDVATQPRGAGYWIWKPWLILKYLEYIPEGDWMLYMDSGDLFNEHRLRYFDPDTYVHDIITFINGIEINAHWTKRDCFVDMDCDTYDYHNSPEVEAGIVFLRNTPFTKEFVTEWLKYCSIRSAVTDEPNKHGLPNLPGFVDHRHDQSILGLLREKYKEQVALIKFDGLMHLNI